MIKSCVVFTLFLSCSFVFAEPKIESANISTAEAAAEIAKNLDLTIIDVRTPREYAEGHLKGAININIKDASFEDELAKLDRNKPYLIDCKSGGRSARALNVFKKLNFQHVLHMNDGFIGWTKAKQPIVK